MAHRWILLLISLLLWAAACSPQPASLPTLVELPSVTPLPSGTVLPTVMRVAIRPTLPSTWTLTPTDTPYMSATPSPVETATATPTPTGTPTNTQTTTPITPVITNTPHTLADLSYAEAERLLKSAPLMLTPEAHIREIYARGQQLGRENRMVIPVGDCNSESHHYLEPLTDARKALQEVDDSWLEDVYIQASITYFAEALAQKGVAANSGFTAYSVMDPLWADKNKCAAGESPLACDIRKFNPAVALIMFGANDMNVLHSSEYESALRDIIEYTLEQGVIPVLSTFAHNPFPYEGNRPEKAIRLNAIVYGLALEYQIPFINFWLTSNDLPWHGLMGDNAHLVISGHNERNRLAMLMLDYLRQNIFEPPTAGATSVANTHNH